MSDTNIPLSTVKAGDPDSLKLIFEQNRERVYRTAYDMLGNREDAEDVSQEVFLKVYRSMADFRGEARLSTWLYRITINACHDVMARKAYKTTKPIDPLEQQGQEQPLFHSDAVSPGRRAASAVLGRHIEQALDSLTPRERSVFVLRHYEDLPMKEIARILEVSDGAVRSTLFRALQRLQEELSHYKQDLGWEGSR